MRGASGANGSKLSEGGKCEGGEGEEGEGAGLRDAAGGVEGRLFRYEISPVSRSHNDFLGSRRRYR